MSTSYQKICSLLAAADIGDREIYEFVSTLNSISPNEVMRHVADIRRLLTVGPENYDHDSRFWAGGNHYSAPSETETKITKILLEEAGLPKNLAIALMTEELQKRCPFEVPHESRKGFSSWLRRLVTIVPESELLHIAMRIRNEYVHEQRYDWQLK
jgi:hypothetical protein